MMETVLLVSNDKNGYAIEKEEFANVYRLRDISGRNKDRKIIMTNDEMVKMFDDYFKDNLK